MFNRDLKRKVKDLEGILDWRTKEIERLERRYRDLQFRLDKLEEHLEIKFVFPDCSPGYVMVEKENE
jgi:chaperonin cofactor prefoldin